MIVMGEAGFADALECAQSPTFVNKWMLLVLVGIRWT